MSSFVIESPDVTTIPVSSAVSAVAVDEDAATVLVTELSSEFDGTSTNIVTSADDDAIRSGSEHVTVFAGASVHVPGDIPALYVVPAGIVSTIDTPVASDGPALLTLMTYSIVSPAFTGSTMSTFSTESSLTTTTGVISSADTGGEVADVAVAVLVMRVGVVEDGTNAVIVIVVDFAGGGIIAGKSNGSHVTTPPNGEPSCVQVALAPTNATISGSMSVTTISVASDGPSFSTSIV